MIRMIALDLDGTTLNNEGRLTDKTRAAIEAAIKKNVKVVIATGRVLSALPEELLEIKGIQHAITSNGANIIDLKTRRAIYQNFLKPEVVESLVETLRKYDYMVEVFTRNHAYIDKQVYRNVQSNGSIFNNTEYLLSTRRPVENIYEHILALKDSIENINLNIVSQQDRMRMREILERHSDICITSSFDYNLEICGETTSKAEALGQLSKMLQINMDEVMACGDSHNDIEMLKKAGLSVAVANAKTEVKQVSKYITPSNDENGVAMAIRRFVLLCPRVL